MPPVARPISDFEPRERIVLVPHTTRRFSCRSGLAISPDDRTLAFVADLGAGTFSVWTLPLDTPGKPAPAVESARLFLDQLGYLQRWVEEQAKFPTPENKAEALSRIAQARSIYEKLAERN